MKKVIILFISLIILIVSLVSLFGYKLFNGDFNLSGSVMAALAFTSSGAILVSVGAFLKNYFNTFVEFISSRIGFSITANTALCTQCSNQDTYVSINKWASKIDKKVIKNNIMISNYNEKIIGYGNYFIFIDNFTTCRIRKTLHQDSKISYEDIYVKFIGLNVNKYKKDIQQYIKNDADKYKKCLNIEYWNSPHNWRNMYQNKKNNDYVFGNYYNKFIKIIDNWISLKPFYNKANITYKLGILLYGEPGTGKSSLAKVLASHYNYKIIIPNIYNLKDAINNNTNDENKIVLIEDIDYIYSMNTKERSFTTNSRIQENDNSESITRELLNLFDGVASPSNIIFIATTNHIEKINPTIIRPGRFDIKMEIKGLKKEDAEKMCKAFGHSTDILDKETFPVNPAKLQTKLMFDLYENKLLK